MPIHIKAPTRIEAAGNLPKLIDEYVGRVTSKDAGVSIAHMRSPPGWVEPGQTPEFDEYTVVLKGMLRVSTREGDVDVRAGEAIHTRPGEWIRYSTPLEGGAEYMAVCLPAFSPGTVHRDSSNSSYSYSCSCSLQYSRRHANLPRQTAIAAFPAACDEHEHEHEHEM